MSGDNRMFFVQIQRADKGLPKLGQEMQGAAQKGYVSPDGLSAGQPADGLIDNCLKDGSGKVFLRGAFIDQRLDIRLGKYAAPRRNGVQRLIAFGIFIQPGGIRLQKGSHLVDEGSGTACTDPVHSLFYVSVLEIDDLGVFSSELDGNIRFWRIGLKRFRDGNHFLHKRNMQMLRQSQSAGTGNNRIDLNGTQLLYSPCKKKGQGFLYIGIMPFIVRKQDPVFFIQNGDFNGSGTDVDSKSVTSVHISGRCAAFTSHFSLVFFNDILYANGS